MQSRARRLRASVWPLLLIVVLGTLLVRQPRYRRWLDTWDAEPHVRLTRDDLEDVVRLRGLQRDLEERFPVFE